MLMGLALGIWLWCTACLADGPVYRLTLEAGGTVCYASAVHVGDGALVTVYHSFRPTENQPNIKPEEWSICVDGLPGELVGSSPDNDLALIQVDGLDGESLTVSPEGYEPDESEVSVSGYPGGGADLAEYTGSIDGVWQDEDGHDMGIVLTCPCEQGMSGGAVVDANGVLIGVVHGVDDRRHCWAISRVTFTRFCGHLPEVCPAWRPVLFVWSSATCGPCLAFWRDFDQDANFRNHILTYYRVVHRDAGRWPAFAAWWNVTGVPCFIGPADRVYGYRGKQDLLVRLGIAAPAVDSPSQPQPPPQPHTDTEREPTPAQPIESTPPVNFDELMGRLDAIERALAALERRGEEGMDRFDNQIHGIHLDIDRIDETLLTLPAGPPGPQGPMGEPGPTGPPGQSGDVSALLAEIESLRAELAAMREAELTVNVYQPDGSVESGTVEIFDPEDSLDLNFFGRGSR